MRLTFIYRRTQMHPAYNTCASTFGDARKQKLARPARSRNLTQPASR